MSFIFLSVTCSEATVLTPLETLNTNLNYKILDGFIGKMTDSTLQSLSNSLNLNPTSVVPFPSPNG